MTNTTYYNLNIVEGTDIVNPLTVDNPNYEKIDEAMHDNAVAGVTLASEVTNATIHALTRENSDCSVIRFIATSQWKAGDSVTVDGVPVLALLPSGETLPDGAYVINANVLCVLTGTNLTVYVGKKVDNASEIAYKDTTVAAELVRLDGEIVRQDGEIVRQDGEIVRINGEIVNINNTLANLPASTGETPDFEAAESVSLSAVGNTFTPTKRGILLVRYTASGANAVVELSLSGRSYFRVAGVASGVVGNMPLDAYKDVQISVAAIRDITLAVTFIPYK